MRKEKQILHFFLVTLTLSCALIRSLFGLTGAYVTNFRSNNVSVIDIATQTVIATIPVGTGPSMEWASPDLTRVYVYNGLSATVSVINTTTEQVMATIAVGTNTVLGLPASANSGVYEGGAMTSDGLKLLIANADNNNVSIIDTNPLSPSFNTVIATVTGTDGASLWTTGITPDNHFAYVGNFNNGFMHVIDLTTNVVIATINAGASSVPPGAAVLPNGLFAYAAPSLGPPAVFVSVISTTTQSVVATIPTGGDPAVYLSSNPASTRVYASLGSQFTLDVIDTGTNTVIATISFPNLLSTPNYSIVNGAGTATYLSTGATGSGGVNVIDNVSNTTTATISLVTEVQFTGLTPDQAHLYVPVPAFNNVFVIDTATNSVVGTVGAGTNPFFVVFSNAGTPSPVGPGTPGSPTGRQEADCFFDQFDLINVIQWTASSGSPVKYNIYRNAALTDLAGSVPASRLKFKDHNRKKGVTYTYYIVAVDGSGNTSSAAIVTVTPKRNPCRAT